VTGKAGLPDFQGLTLTRHPLKPGPALWMIRGSPAYHCAMTVTLLIEDDHPTFRSFARLSDYGDDISSWGAAGFVAKDQVSGQAIRALLGSAS